MKFIYKSISVGFKDRVDTHFKRRNQRQYIQNETLISKCYRFNEENTKMRVKKNEKWNERTHTTKKSIKS